MVFFSLSNEFRSWRPPANYSFRLINGNHRIARVVLSEFHCGLIHRFVLCLLSDECRTDFVGHKSVSGRWKSFDTFVNSLTAIGCTAATNCFGSGSTTGRNWLSASDHPVGHIWCWQNALFDAVVASIVCCCRWWS